LEFVFSDIWGSALESSGHYKYYVSFIDDYSKFIWIYLIKFKSEVIQKNQEFQALVERLFDRKILAMQTDWGGEYKKLNSFFHQLGISHFVSWPHARQQNGAAERKYRHVVEVGLPLLAYAHMPLKYWDEAFLAATFLINCAPSKVISYFTPLEQLFHVKPNFSSLRIFGCSCWPHLHPFNSHKLEFRSKEYVFLGYSNMHKGFKWLDLSIGHIYISWDIVFYENVFPFMKLQANSCPKLQSEILLLPPTLLNPTAGDALVTNHVPNMSTTTNDHAAVQNTLKNALVPEENNAGTNSGGDTTANVPSTASGVDFTAACINLGIASPNKHSSACGR
jgi:hypothetical protein